jgi:hypothetical protein
VGASKKLKRRDFIVCSRDLDRLEACPGAGVYVLPRKPKTTYPQWYGIFVHRFLEYCVDRGHEAALEYIRAKRIKGAVRTCERIDPEQLLYGQVEVGWCHDPFDDTSRRVPWSLMPTVDVTREQFGKADLVVELDVPRPLIADYKCGGHDGRPATSSQLLGLAAAYRAETGVSELDVAIAGVMSSGEVRWATQTVDGCDLDRYVERALRAHRRVLAARTRADEGAQPEFVRGSVCTWCSLHTACPAWK